MDVAEPRVRRRGLFVTPHDVDSESADHPEPETAEGVSIRVHITRRKIRVHTSRHSSASVTHRRHAIKSATAIDSRRRSRTRR